MDWDMYPELLDIIQSIEKNDNRSYYWFLKYVEQQTDLEIKINENEPPKIPKGMFEANQKMDLSNQNEALQQREEEIALLKFQACYFYVIQINSFLMIYLIVYNKESNNMLEMEQLHSTRVKRVRWSNSKMWQLLHQPISTVSICSLSDVSWQKTNNHNALLKRYHMEIKRTCSHGFYYSNGGFLNQTKGSFNALFQTSCTCFITIQQFCFCWIVIGVVSTNNLFS